MGRVFVSLVFGMATAAALNHEEWVVAGFLVAAFFVHLTNATP